MALREKYFDKRTFYSNRKNKLYTWSILKLHGSINWYIYVKELKNWLQKEDAIAIRRGRVLELTSKGYSQREIASILQISHGAVGYDQLFLSNKAKQNIKLYVDERLPEEYEKCLVGLTSILREEWNTSPPTIEDNKEKIQALIFYSVFHHLPICFLIILSITALHLYGRLSFLFRI